ncbi:2-succinyl-5-enolpyruvyl-6-hydroxy-3-cyclohexene-1-carboxylic-acid synthase [Corynebacterium freiburgense]|uniref:2-succinyl-5-enolpyruvyl-6-hydroxy-3- cyclohexene-1-carboxylic-acid synthase n=1 Tax=Corynebacterium freiburgense TaxID=556548 RepID=UPI000400D052|nr:2-succinyl-5-enolpyruvyl-6-hydroxy-3-cyclohexene-1-carboxylic-acid synthase [Corynebacterium freiburgense]WJZ01599.1 2-succinyl-5-enolpyruvyl-6-hydroxy-3-cyclohexene-1-carboxylate synthase [Corynebacterium freiburgense]
MSSASIAADVVAELAAVSSDIVVCPGSRNAPLLLALRRRSDIRIHVRIDERSAAFLALGLARAQKRPVAVVMTSGTAVAHCLPAMIEAHHSNIPLIVVSADRPSRLVGTGASQTIDQQELFGKFAETFHIEFAENGITGKAIEAAPAHLNVALDTPLAEVAEPVAVERRRAGASIRDYGEVELDLSRRTLVIAGDGAWSIEELADVPTIAEPSAPAPFAPVHPLAAGILARTQVSAEGYVVETKPEQVVVVGHPTLHRGVLKLMSDPEIDLIVLTRTTPTDPARKAQYIGSRVRVKGKQDSGWLKMCSAASELAGTTVRETLEKHSFTGLHAAAAVADTLAVGDVLVLGASNPVRDASLVGLPFDGVETYAQRGVAGIDGMIAQSIGIALAKQTEHLDTLRPPRVVALMGDLTFLHDIGSLQIGPLEARSENLTIVVANDNGGGIFELLEVGAKDLRDDFERVFGTPHNVDIAALCAGYGISHVAVSSVGELTHALLDTIDIAPGIRVIEATTRRDNRREMHLELKL